MVIFIDLVELFNFKNIFGLFFENINLFSYKFSLHPYVKLIRTEEITHKKAVDNISLMSLRLNFGKNSCELNHREYENLYTYGKVKVNINLSICCQSLIVDKCLHLLSYSYHFKVSML